MIIVTPLMSVEVELGAFASSMYFVNFRITRSLVIIGQKFRYSRLDIHIYTSLDRWWDRLSRYLVIQQDSSAICGWFRLCIAARQSAPTRLHRISRSLITESIFIRYLAVQIRVQPLYQTVKKTVIAQPLKCYMWVYMPFFLFYQLIYLYDSLSFWQFFHANQSQQQIHDSGSLQMSQDTVQVLRLSFDKLKHLC